MIYTEATSTKVSCESSAIERSNQGKPLSSHRNNMKAAYTDIGLWIDGGCRLID